MEGSIECRQGYAGSFLVSPFALPSQHAEPSSGQGTLARGAGIPRYRWEAMARRPPAGGGALAGSGGSAAGLAAAQNPLLGRAAMRGGPAAMELWSHEKSGANPASGRRAAWHHQSGGQPRDRRGEHGPTELRALSCLTEVTGTLTIATFSPLKNLEDSSIWLASASSNLGQQGAHRFGGLSQLREVSTSLRIADNPKLHSFAALKNLTFIGDALVVEDNPSLTAFEGLDALVSIGGSVSISERRAHEPRRIGCTRKHRW